MIHNVDPQFSQWDVGRIVSISDSDATHIHFANQGDSKAVIMEITEGSVKVPDYLLQTGKNVIAYAVKDGVTLESKSFPVRKRERPENYIYEDDQRNYFYALLSEAKAAIEKATEAAEQSAYAVLYKPQTLTPEQQGQTKRNIGATDYYFTEREELGADYEKVNAPNTAYTAYIRGLYDALMAEYPDNVQKIERKSNDGTFTNYEYVISTGEYYSTGGYYTKSPERDRHIKKPKYLILSGIHGIERKAVLSAYRFIRDVLRGHNIPSQFREGCVISIMPVASPSGIDAYTRNNGDGVQVNNNFNCTVDGAEVPGLAQHNETQAITNWLEANNDAKLFIDCHNGIIVDEVAMVASIQSEIADNAKKIAMRGLDRVIPFWRTVPTMRYKDGEMVEVIGYQPMIGVRWIDGEQVPSPNPVPPTFSNSLTINVDGMAITYATAKLKIPSFSLELSDHQNGDYTDYLKNTLLTTPETIASGAEAIGNILIEFYFDTGEVVDMTETNSKLETLVESVNSLSKGFRTESGTMNVPEDKGSRANQYKVEIPCTSGAKFLIFTPDDATRNVIVNTPENADSLWLVGFVGQVVSKIAWGNKTNLAYRGYMSIMKPEVGWVPFDHGTTGFNDGTDGVNGFSFNCTGIKAGTYNWTAYYWNE